MTLKSRRTFSSTKEHSNFIFEEKAHFHGNTTSNYVNRKKKKKKSHPLWHTQNNNDTKCFFHTSSKRSIKTFSWLTHFFFLISSYWIRRRGRRSMRSQKKLSLNVRHWQWQEHRWVTKDSIEREREKWQWWKEMEKVFNFISICHW